MTRRDDMHDAHRAAALLPGATVRRVPSKRGLRPIQKSFFDVVAGDMHDYGRVAAVEVDPFVFDLDACERYGLDITEYLGTVGRNGWVVFEDGSRAAESATVTVWVPCERNG